MPCNSMYVTAGGNNDIESIGGGFNEAFDFIDFIER